MYIYIYQISCIIYHISNIRSYIVYQISDHKSNIIYCIIYHISNIISFHIISNHFISFHIISYHFISYHIISYDFISYIYIYIYTHLYISFAHTLMLNYHRLRLDGMGPAKSPGTNFRFTVSAGAKRRPKNIGMRPQNHRKTHRKMGIS